MHSVGSKGLGVKSGWIRSSTDKEESTRRTNCSIDLSYARPPPLNAGGVVNRADPPDPHVWMRIPRVGRTMPVDWQDDKPD